MHGKMRKTAFVVLLTAGFFTVAPVTHADIATSGDGSILGGNQVLSEVDAPVNVCQNAIAVLGVAGSSSCSTGDVAIVKSPPVEERPHDGCEGGPEEGREGRDECDWTKPEVPKQPSGPKEPETPKQPKAPKEVEEVKEKPKQPGQPGTHEVGEKPQDSFGLQPPEDDDPSTAPQVPEGRSGADRTSAATALLPVTGTETNTLLNTGIVAMILGAVALCIGYSRHGRKDGPTL